MNEKIGDVSEKFGIDVFDEEKRRKYLPKDVFERLENTIKDGKELDHDIADAVAKGMKEWAMTKGATHYTHWFSPLSGVTAEKHDSFLNYDKKGKAIMDFSGKELIRGEPDASSFPNGGLRATFEARGYTAWDCTSPAFVISDEYGSVLYIPTAFCSYNGDSLDEKTPLLRSKDYLSSKAVEALRIFGDEKTSKVYSFCGPEQEYFLVEADAYAHRKDLIYTGRTLFGASAPKGQELEDHYFGPIRDQISSFMSDVNRLLWRLGIPAKTEHNEVAPSQHELAVIYQKSSIAADQNALVMQILKKVAKKHGLICLLAEKPFEGVNGSGKHVNWSVAKEDGTNLFKPGKTENDKLRFLTFLTCVIKGVDEYAVALRESVASYTNDFRLGANEAPPAIVSMFLGEELSEEVRTLTSGSDSHKKKASTLSTGVKSIPTFDKDTTDRNRTSPFAFTGNRFEFRMVGSLQNISEPLTVLNTMMGKELEEFVKYIGNATGNEKTKKIKTFIKNNLKEHTKVLFDGDGYSKEWVDEAEKRGLKNLRTTVDAIEAFSEKSIQDLFLSTGVYSKREIDSRIEIKYQNYSALAMIDAKTMSHMAHKQYLPSANNALGKMASEIAKLESCTIAVPKSTRKTAIRVSALIEEAGLALDRLDRLVEKCDSLSGRELALFCKDNLLPQMERLRSPIDQLELLIAKDCWPVPSYGDLLYHIL